MPCTPVLPGASLAESFGMPGLAGAKLPPGFDLVGAWSHLVRFDACCTASDQELMVSQTAIEISLNGEAAEVAADATVADVLLGLGLDPTDPKGIAVAVNDEVVRKEDWTSRSVDAGDRVEVITARQGG